MHKIENNDYLKLFIKNRTYSEINKTYEKAWEAKNFEITNYWKRTTYFWAFQVASFTGVFALKNSQDWDLFYLVLSVGFITALGWHLVNIGSKEWQNNWEQHVEILEDYITGPLYKIVFMDNTFSVSRINSNISLCITVFWIISHIYFLLKINLIQKILLLYRCHIYINNLFIIIIMLCNIIFSLVMLTCKSELDIQESFYICSRSNIKK